MPTAITESLRKKGVDVVTALEAGKLGDTDLDHLAWARANSRVMCTHDQDFLRIGAKGFEHAGIVFGQQDRSSIGVWGRALVDLHARLSAEEMMNRVEFV
ncbi:MAG: DUF5615 family PIN-like protein [Anaerolineae bacterium]|nr:DUF5615 family PIN-like protein [Anaerolineae bacterium]